MKSQVTQTTGVFGRRKRLFLLSSLLIFSVFNTVFGQSPGGVNTNLRVWLKANAGFTPAAWTDQSGAGNTYTQTNATRQPSLAAANGAFNFNPSVNFNSHFMVVPSGKPFTANNKNGTVFVIVNHTSIVGNQDYLGFGATTTGAALTNANNPVVGMAGSTGNPYWYDGDWPISTGIANEVDKTALLDFRWTYNALTAQPILMSKNGVSGYSTAILTNLINTASGSILGSQPEDLKADMGEIIAYEENLTGTALEKVRSYLAIKYGLTLNHNYLSATGSTIYSLTGYANNVAGIGREDAQGLDQKQSKSVNAGFQPTIGLTSIATSNSANGATFTDATYLMWGNDGGSTSFGAALTAPSGLTANNRMNRIWKVQETGSVGTVKFAIPQVGSGGTVYLIRSTDATFDATDTWIPLSNLTVGSTNYLAGDINFNNGDYFTVATYITAPGCVASGLDFWLDPSKNVTKSGNLVTDWDDADANGNNPSLVQATTSIQPEFSAGDELSNFNPYIDFSGSDRLYQDLTGSSFSNSHTTFGVVNQYGTKTSYSHFIRFSSASNSDGGTHNWGLGYPDIAQSKVGLHYITAPFAGVAPGNVYNRVNGNRTILQNVPTLYSASLNSATGATAVGHNGNEVLATGLSGGSFVPYNSLTVGGGTVYGMSDNKTQEIIHYSRELTVQERQRVQTYLAIKHGITLDNQDNSAAIVEGDYILGDGTTKIWDKTANATYHGNILGIGRDDCQGLNQKQSKSVNGGFQPLLATTGFAATNLTNTSGFTADKSFLVAGSDNGATSYAVPMAFPAGVVANNRMTRIWKVQETGTVGTVKLAIPSSSNQTYLVISNDATFDLSDTYVEMTNYTGGGVNYLATDINFTSGQYFSFASYVSAPGCVAADLKMWLKADEGVTATANKVSSWADAGGNMTVVQNTATRQPTWVDNVMNFNPALDYTGGQSLTATTGGQAVLPGVNDPATIVAVSTNRTVGGGWKTLVSFGGPADYPSLHWYGDQPSLYIDATTTVHNLHTTSLPLNTPYIFNSSTNNASPKDVKVSYNGFLTSRQTFTGADGQFPTAANSNPLVIGAETDAAGEPLDGYLTEAIAYNRVLTDAELQRVNSYLGIKYGITLDHNYVNGRGFEVYDRSTFGNNVFGIGREICSGLHQKQSKSINANTKMTIGIADSIAPTNAAHPSGLATDTTYIVIGDNAGTGTTGYTGGGACAPPPTADKFTNLNYKVTETGSVQSVRIKFNAAGLDFNNTYPVYMQVATDAAFTNMISNVPMQWSGSNIETNYNFPASSTSYVRFIGNTTNLANVCTASTPQTFHFNGWWYGVKNKTIVANYGATANAGDMVMKTTVTDGTPNVLLYRPTVDWWPVFDGYGLFFPRYGNAASENSTMTTKIEFLSQATTGVANASATKLAAATASFMIWDLDGYIGSRDIVKVYGKIGSQIVDPKLTRNKYTALTLNHGGDPQSVIGGVLPWDLSYWGRLYVDFESPVEEIYIEYKQDATYAFKTYQDFRIGPITATCKAPSPKVKLVDNVYVYKQVGSPVKSGDKAVYKFAIQNLDCGNKTINFSDILPSGSGLTWADSSLATSLNFASNNAYGNSQTLTINGLVVPSGISYLVMEAKTSTTGTFNNQATYTVGANNYLSDDPNQSGINSPTPLTVIANDPDANLTIAKTVNAATAQQNGILTYTFVVTNPNGAAVKATVTDILPASTGGVSPTYVASSLTGASGAIVSPYDGESSLTIRDLSVPANGSLTLTIQANVGAFTQGDTIKNVATVTPDVSEGFRIIEKPSSEANTEILAPCAAGNTAPTLTATTRSNTCPATTANLSTITATNRPSGTVLTFHSATPATYGNRVADSTAVGAGTYYAAFYDGASGCFSNSGNGTTAVTVSINACITCTGTTIPKTTIAPSTGTVADNYVVNSQFKIVSLSAGGGYTDAGYGYRFGTPTATTDRNYKLVFTNPVTSAVLEFGFINNDIAINSPNPAGEEQIANITAVGATSPVYEFQDVSSLGMANVWNPATRTIASTVNSFGENSSSKLKITSATPFTEITLTHDYITGTNPFGVLLEEVCYELAPTCASGNTPPVLTATTGSNTCPATTANLSTITATNQPVGTVLTFHSATPATYGNRVADSTAVGAGTYYAAFYDGASGCFSNSGNGTTAVTVTIGSCSNTLCTTLSDQNALFLAVSSASGGSGIYKISNIVTTPSLSGTPEISYGGNTITGLTLANNLNGGTGYAFYGSNLSLSPAEYSYTTGVSWTNTGHIASYHNHGGGMNAIYSLQNTGFATQAMMKYIGTGAPTNIATISAPIGTFVQDVAVDANGKVYVLTGSSLNTLREYDANGTALTTYTVTGLPTGNSYLGLVMLNGSLYAYRTTTSEIYKGTLSGATVSFTLHYTLPAGYTIDDLAGCPNVAGTLAATCASGSTPPVLTATTRSNTCPATTANLSTITATNRPSGTVLTFHSATPATYGNRVADSTAVGAGTYYAAFYDGTSGCFSNSGNGTTAVTVTITSPCPTAPVFTNNGGGATASINYAENGVTPVTTVAASGTPAPTYSIVGGADATKFSINPTTGVLTFIASPDFENPTDAGANNVYDVMVQASNAGGSVTQTIAVTVTDVAECTTASVGGTTNYTGGVVCNASNSGTITLSGQTGSVVRWETSTNGGGAWTAIANTSTSYGFTNAANGQQYRAVINNGAACSDANATATTISTSATACATPDLVTTIGQPAPVLMVGQPSDLPITVKNIGGAPAPGVITTTITLPSGVSTLPTFTSNGSMCNTVGQVVTCTNPGPIAANDSIVINVPITPAASTAGTSPEFNASTSPVTGETITANNTAPPTSAASPVGTPTTGFTNNGGGSNIAISYQENGNSPVTTVAANGSPAPTYSIVGGADAAKFSINPTTGVLTFIASPDFENPTDAGADNVYDVIVQASNAGGSVMQTIAVTVTDGPECSATSIGGTAAYTGGVVCSTTNVGTLTLSGQTGAVATWQTSTNGGTLWTDIAGTAGKNTYNFINATNGQQYRALINNGIGCLDAGATPVAIATSAAACTAATCSYNTTDFNPTITAPTGANFTTHLLLVNPTNGNIAYATAAGSNAFTSVIAGNYLLYAITYDNTIAPNPTLTIGTNLSAIGGGCVSYSDALPTKVCPAVPVITSNGGGATAAINYAENGIIPVTTVTSGGSPMYSIVGGADATKFNINPTTGVLTFRSSPDFETPTDANGDNVYSVIVQATNSAGMATQTINVTVTDVLETEIAGNGIDDDGNDLIDCHDTGSAPCDCNYTGGIAITPPVSNPSATHTRRYVLTDSVGVILEVSNNPTFSGLTPRKYRAYTAFYDPAVIVNPLVIGVDIDNISAVTFSKSLPRLEKVCSPVGKYEVSFALKTFDCATRQAVIRVRVRASSMNDTFRMGDANYRFDYDPRRIHTPVILSEENYSSNAPANNSAYASQNLMGSSAGVSIGTVSLNTSFSGGTPQTAQLVDTAWTTVACIGFTAVDTSTCFDLLWHNDMRFPVTGMTGVIQDNSVTPQAYDVASGGVYDNLNYCWKAACNCVYFDLKALLEGPYQTATGRMTTILNQRGLLPGQTPIGGFAVPTPAGQPFNTAPWNYAGTESITNYPATVTDWVLVTVRTDSSVASTVTRKAALLHNDGTITFLDSCWILNVAQRYHVMVEHRNHMGVMSATTLPIVANRLTADFTTMQGFVLTNPPSTGQKLVGTKYVMLTGDGQKATRIANYDINFQDSQLWRIQSGIFDCYKQADHNLDADVNFMDSFMWKQNNGKYSGVPH